MYCGFPEAEAWQMVHRHTAADVASFEDRANFIGRCVYFAQLRQVSVIEV